MHRCSWLPPIVHQFISFFRFLGIVLPHRERRPASDLHAEVNAIGRCAMLGYLGETLPNMVWSGKNI